MLCSVLFASIALSTSLNLMDAIDATAVAALEAALEAGDDGNASEMVEAEAEGGGSIPAAMAAASLANGGVGAACCDCG
jgi:hypothetical protein